MQHKLISTSLKPADMDLSEAVILQKVVANLIEYKKSEGYHVLPAYDSDTRISEFGFEKLDKIGWIWELEELFDIYNLIEEHNIGRTLGSLTKEIIRAIREK